jgi:hypothetical protein
MIMNRTDVNLAKGVEFTVGGFWIPNPDPEPGFEEFVKKSRFSYFLVTWGRGVVSSPPCS